MMAEIDEEYTISDAVTALGEMLHYNMRWNKFLVTVQDEMNYIQNYVELMNLRYDFTITLSVQIPEICIGRISPRCLFSRLWKMQSKYGFCDIFEGGLIRISVTEQAGQLTFSVYNNGTPMEEQMAEKLNGLSEIPVSK
mgnify:CR=1 FL=1